MKRVALLMAILFMVSTPRVEARDTKSETIVYINGQKYYIHNVETGETLYSLSKLYDVEISEIESNNTSVKESGLSEGVTIKIPVKSAPKSGNSSKSLDRKTRKNFTTHKVSQGETLYAISRKHEISVAVIVEDNPDIDPANLTIGQTILIRKKEMGKSSQEESLEELEEYKETMNRVAPEGYEYHIVAPRETLYSLLRSSQMSHKEFMEINNLESSELKVGSIVIIRSSKQTADVDSNVEQSLQPLDDEDSEVQFMALRGNDTLEVSLLLPLTNSSGSLTPIFEEFYQGFLLGVEDLKNIGRSVNVTLYDTKRDRATVREIISTSEFQRSDLIVGPVYEELLGDVLKFAERRSIPVVSPLATLQSSNSGVLFQMAPIAEHKYDKIADILSDSVEVTLIYTDNTDSQYEAEVRELLGAKSYKTHKYEYEHPSVAVERAKEAERNGLELDELELSPSDLSPLISGDSTATIFIMPDNETDVDRILSALASAEIGLRSRSIRVSNFTVMNNSKWNRYNNIDRAMLFRNRVTAFTSYHAKRDSQIIKEFDSRYAEEFSELPTLYSYRGYDVAKIFGEGLYSDIEYGMEGRTFTPLQTTYRFQRIRDKESRANQNWMRVNYRKNFTITLE